MDTRSTLSALLSDGSLSTFNSVCARKSFGAWVSDSSLCTGITLLSLVALNTLLTSVTLFALARVDGIHIGLVCVGLFPSISASLGEPVFVTGKGVGLNLRGELS